MHWAIKVSLLLDKYQLNVTWSDLARSKWLRGARAALQRLQSERLLDVLWLRTALVEYRAWVCKRHATTRWSLQTPASAREIFVPIRTWPSSPESDRNARVLPWRDQHVQRQSSVVLPGRPRSVLVRQYDHEVLFRFGSWRALVCHSKTEKCRLGRLVTPWRQLQTQNGIRS